MSDQGKKPLPETGPTGNLRPPQNIAAQVRDALRANGYVDASEIRVDVDESGTLTLTGTVPSNEQKQLSQECGESVPGITSVINQLSISSLSGTVTKDPGREFGKDSETARRPARTLGIEPE